MGSKAMAVQKSKKSRSKRGMRRSHDSVKSINFQTCKHTGELYQAGRVVATSEGLKDPRTGKSVSIISARKQLEEQD